MSSNVKFTLTIISCVLGFTLMYFAIILGLLTLENYGECHISNVKEIIATWNRRNLCAVCKKSIGNERYVMISTNGADGNMDGFVVMHQTCFDNFTGNLTPMLKENNAKDKEEQISINFLQISSFCFHKN